MGKLHARWLEAARFSGRWSFGPTIQALGGAEAFEQASGHQLGTAGVPPRLVEALLRARGSAVSSDSFARLGDVAYPARFLDLAKPPPIIWWRGALKQCVQVQGLAVVGARSCTGYGRILASRLGSLEAGSGGVLISGAARGIDRSAHRGALEFGRTLAVLGAGLSAPVSSAQRRHLELIVQGGGALVSEFPPAQSPSRWTFPQRNRLVAALSRAVVVVEAKERSGARITANFARDLGREVYAVPGRVDSPESEGCHQLIAEGAHILVRLTDPIWERSLLQRESLPPILRILLSGPLPSSELHQRSRLDTRSFRKAVGQYELAGLVQRLPGARLALA